MRFCQQTPIHDSDRYSCREGIKSLYCSTQISSELSRSGIPPTKRVVEAIDIFGCLEKFPISCIDENAPNMVRVPS